ncbi:MAG: hypothetical protein VB104_07005 [Candidatus Limiplasma sp.]|nr:hypothetical protein [Candidatus Limiplasma sp.]
MFDTIREYFLRKRRLKVSMHDLVRNGLCCRQLHGDVTWAQKLHTLLYGH